MKALQGTAYVLALIGPYLLTLYALDAVQVPTWAALLGANVAGLAVAALVYWCGGKGRQPDGG